MVITDNMNSKNLELYSIIGEYDNAGFPLSYCLLSTVSAIEPGKQRKALIKWAKCMCNMYSVRPRFTHADKDMAEINMLWNIWDVKIQLCWWHLQDAIHKQLGKSKVSTTSYNVIYPQMEFQFIDPKFIPPGHPDINEYEGSMPDDIHQQSALSQLNPNSVSICIPIPESFWPTLTSSPQTIPVKDTMVGSNAPAAASSARLVIKFPGHLSDKNQLLAPSQSETGRN
jgi:hypothetical protein